MAGEQQQPSGFKLPAPSGQESVGGATGLATPPGQAQRTQGTTEPVVPEADTLGRDTAIGAGVLLLLVIAFVFAKNAYANALVGRKVAPRSANAAGWWLFIVLTSLATVAVLGFVNQARFLTLFFIVPLGFVALVSLVLMLVSSRR